MEFNEGPAKETENKVDENFSDVEEFKSIIYKLVMHKGLNEEDRRVIDKIVEKKDKDCNNL